MLFANIPKDFHYIFLFTKNRALMEVRLFDYLTLFHIKLYVDTILIQLLE